MRSRLVAGSWQTLLGAIVVAAGIVACDGIITGPEVGSDTSPRSMRATPGSMSLDVRDTATFEARLYTVSGAEAVPEAGRAIVYVSADPLVAAIDPVTGLVTAVSSGTTTVRGEYGALTLGIPVTVAPGGRLVKVGGDEQTAEQADTLGERIAIQVLGADDLPVSDVIPEVISISDGGEIGEIIPSADGSPVLLRWRLGLALGTQTVQLSAPGYDTVTFTATAVAGTRVVRVAIDEPASTAIMSGETLQLSAQAFNVADVPLAGTAITWSGGADAVATISADGLVTAVGAGSALFVASAAGVADSITIAVTPSLLPKLSLGADITHPAQLQAPRTLRLPANAGDAVTVTLTSSQPSAVLLAANDAVAGAASLPLEVAAGTNESTYWMQGLAGAAGTTLTVIATATGYEPDTLQVLVSRPAFTLTRIGAASLPATGGEDPVVVLTVGQVEGVGAITPLAISAGVTAPLFTITSDAPTRALAQHFATAFTVGADQGPAAQVSFGLAPSRSQTSDGTVGGTPASVRVARTGTGGAVNVSATGSAEFDAVAGATVAFNFVVNTPIISVTPVSFELTAITGASETADASASVTNTGGGTLTDLEVEVISDPADGDWLFAGLSATTAPTTLNLAANASSLAPGTYTATVRIISLVSGIAPVEIPVSFVVTSARPKLNLGPDVRHPARLQRVFAVSVDPQDADVPITITSSDGASLLLSDQNSPVPATEVTVSFDGLTGNAFFTVSGQPGSSGRTVTLIATSQGYRPDTLVVTMVNAEFILRRTGVGTVSAIGGDDPVMQLIVGGTRTLGGEFEQMPVSVGLAPQAFTLTSTTPATALVRFAAGDATNGADQGPASAVNFGLNPGYSSTFTSDVGSASPTLQLARTGTAGEASVTIAAGDAEWTARVATVGYTLTDAEPGTRNWTGAVSSDWELPANWAEGSVPTANDSVYIAATGVTNMPFIALPVSIRSLVSDNAGTILVNNVSITVAQALVLRTDVLAMDCGGGAVEFTVAGRPSSALGGRMACSAFIQHGHHYLVDSLVIEGSVLVLVENARLTLNGQTIRTPDNQVIVNDQARLEMLNEADVVIAPWVALQANGQGDMFAAGEIRLRDLLTVEPGTSDFRAVGSHRVVMEGPLPTSFARLQTAANVSFRNVELRVPTQVMGTFSVTGNLTLADGATLSGGLLSFYGLPERLRVEGNYTAAPSATNTLRAVELGGALVAPNFSPDTLVLIGSNQVLPFDGSVDGLRSVRVAGTVRALLQPGVSRFLAGDLIVEGDFRIADPALNLFIGVSGNLQVIGNGILRLDGLQSFIQVNANALFDGRAMDGEMANGVLQLGGDLVQRATTSARSLRPSPSFRVIFAGSGATDFATPGESVLGIVEHFGNLTRTLRSDVIALNIVRYDLNNVTVRSEALGAGGTRTFSATGLDMGGAVTVRNVTHRITDGTPIDLTGGPIFRDFDPSVVQLDFIRSAGSVTMDFARFETVPTGAGRYLRLSDPSGAGDGLFTVNASNTFPATHGGFAEAIAPAVLNGWPSGLVTLPKLNAGPDQEHPVALMRPLAGTLPAPLASSLRVTLTSLDPEVALVAVEDEQPGSDTRELNLGEGAATFTWWVHGVEDQVGSTARILFEAEGYESDTVVVTLTRAAARLTAVGATTIPTTGGADPEFVLTVGWDSAGTFRPLFLRTGGPGRDFRVTSSLPSAALLRFNATDRTIGESQGPSESVSFTLNDFNSATQTAIPESLVPSSLALSRPGGTGTAVIALTVPEEFDVVGEPVSVTVTDTPPAPQLAFEGETRIPRWMQRAVNLRLPAPATEPVTFTVSADVAGAVLLAAPITFGPAGEPSYTGTIQVGQQVATIVVQALETSTAPSVTLTATADGYDDATVTIALVQPRVTLSFVGTAPFPAGGAPEPILEVDVGDDVGGAEMRGGITATPFTLSVVGPTAAQLRFVSGITTIGASSGPAASVTFGIAGGWSISSTGNTTPPSDAALRLVPLGEAGLVTLQLTAPSEWNVDDATITFELSPALTPPLALDIDGDDVVNVGGSIALNVTLVTPAPAGGLNVTVTSDDPSIVSVGTGTLTVSANETQGSIFLTGVAPGSTTVRASAVGYTNAALAVTVNSVPGIIVAPNGFALNGVSGTQVTADATAAVSSGDGTPITDLEVEVLYEAGASDWLFAGITGTSVPTTLNLAANPEFLAPGTYNAIVRITSLVGDAPPVDVPVSFVVAEPAAPPALSISIAEGNIIGINLTSSATVALSIPAPVGGVTVTLSSSTSGGAVGVDPLSAFVAEGETSVNFVLEGLDIGPVTLTASAPGYTDGTLDVSVTNQIISTPSTLNVPFGLTTSIPIQLATAAPAGGITVTLASSDPSRVGVVSGTVLIPAGATLASGTLSGVLPGPATITVSAAGWVSDATIATTTATLNIIETSLSINESFGNTISVELRSGATAIAAPAPGLTFSLTALDPSCVGVPATATIATGSTQTTVPVTYGGSAATPCSSRVRVTATNLQPDSIQVNVAQPVSIGLSNATIGGGLQAGTAFTVSASNYGSATVRITSADPTRLLVAPNRFTPGTEFIDVTINAPSTSAAFVLAAVEGATGVVNLTLSAPGFTSAVTSVTIRGLGLDLLSVPTSIASLAPSQLVLARLGYLNAAGTSIEQELELRTGGTPIEVTMTNSNAAVAQLVSSTTAGQSLTATIPLLSSRTPNVLGNGGLLFDPLAAGTTVVAASAPGVVSLPGASRTVTVTAPSVSVNNRTIGSGLQVGSGGSLGASDYGTASVRVESLDPSLVLVAPNGSTAATPFIEFTMTAPTTGFSYFLAGVEGVTGVGRVVVTATGFAPDTAFVTVRGLAVALLSVPTSTNSLASNSLIRAYIGYQDAAGINIAEEMQIRVGGTPITVTVTNSAPAVAQLVTTAVTGQSVTAVISPLDSRTPTTFAGGGIEFDPLGAGTTTISVTAPGLVSAPGATATSTITAPAVSVGNRNIGAGLQVSSGAGLGSPNYGSVIGRVESLDPGLVLVAPNASTAATAFFELPLSGATSIPFTLAGVEGVTGVGRVVVSVPGLTPDTAFVTVRALGVDLVSLPATTTTLSPNTSFTARIGLLNSLGTSIEEEQIIRVGGAPITVTASNSAPTVAQLITTAATAQSVTAVVPVGSSRTPNTVASGGFAFEPLSTGSTTVTVSAPGLVSVSAGGSTVVVNTPAISGGNVTVGSGLRVSAGASLGASDYGSTSVRIESSNPALVVVSPSGDVVGASFIELPLTAPTTTFPFTVAALEGVTGTATITISAPGFTSAIISVTVRATGVELLTAPTTIASTAASATLVARIGYLNAAGTSIESEMALRAGGTPLTVTFTSSAPSVGQLVTSTTTGAAVTAVIGIGLARTPTGTAAGGAMFDPLTAGATTVTVSAPGLLGVNASRSVTVTP